MHSHRKRGHLDYETLQDQNPPYMLTSLSLQDWPVQNLYEQLCCARGEMENRIKEQLSLFADRMSTDTLRANQLRLHFSTLAYVLVEALRRLGLAGTEWAEAQVDTIRLKLPKIAAQVRITARRIWVRHSCAYPWQNIFNAAWTALRRCTKRINKTSSRTLRSSRSV
jgi:Transposase DDE domain group 1